MRISFLEKNLVFKYETFKVLKFSESMFEWNQTKILNFAHIK